MSTANKAWVAAIVAALTSLIATLQGRTDVATMGWVDWLIVVCSTIVAGLAVYIVPNKGSSDPTTSTPDVTPYD
jgi:hypothetical protein